MRLFVTGASGFVGRHLLQAVKITHPEWEVLGQARTRCHLEPLGQADLKILDLANFEHLVQVLDEVRPDAIVHLASYSSVSQSWQHPRVCFQNNTEIFLNILEATRCLGLRTRILSIGSSEEYGPLQEGQVSLDETSALHPASPYAVARAAQEQLSMVYHQGFGLDLVLTRSFNHLGPGHDERFFVPSMARQLLESARQGESEPELLVGNLDMIRDFVDVRDVVTAYLLLIQSGKPGQVYNVCTGREVTLREIVEYMAGKLGLRPRFKVDASRVRPNENPRIVGNPSKLHTTTGWLPSYSLESSLDDVIQSMRRLC